MLSSTEFELLCYPDAPPTAGLLLRRRAESSGGRVGIRARTRRTNVVDVYVGYLRRKAWGTA